VEKKRARGAIVSGTAVARDARIVSHCCGSLQLINVVYFTLSRLVGIYSVLPLAWLVCNTYTCVYIYMCVCVYIYMCVCVYYIMSYMLYIYIYIYIYTCYRLCIYIYTYETVICSDFGTFDT